MPSTGTRASNSPGRRAARRPRRCSPVRRRGRSPRVALQQLGHARGVRDDLGVHLRLPDPARDQLCVLRSEVDDEHGPRSTPRSLRSPPSPSHRYGRSSGPGPLNRLMIGPSARPSGTIPSTSRRATTRSPEGRPAKIGVRRAGGCLGLRAVELRQIDGMAHWQSVQDP